MSEREVWLDDPVTFSGQRIALLLLSCVIAGAVMSACTGKKTDPQRPAALAFLNAVGRGDAAAAGAETAEPDSATASIAASITGLSSPAGSSPSKSPPAVGVFTITGVTNQAASSALVSYRVTWSVPGVSTKWTYDGTLNMSKVNEAWRVVYTPSALHPRLAVGEHLATSETLPTRADLLDSAGQPLFTNQPIVNVGLDATKVRDVTTLAATLAGVLKISASDIVASATSTPAGQFVPVITLRKPAWDAVSPQLADLPGVLTQTGTALLGPATHFGEPLLGVVGPATQEAITQGAGKVVEGDQVGLSGLQKALNSQLIGMPGLAVYAASDTAASTGATEFPAASRIADLRAAQSGTSVKLTIDRGVQSVADATVNGVPLPASIVVTQPSTGKILAVANNAQTTGDAALVGQYPPGSTFKLATYAAAFTANPALTPATPEDCPGTIVVNGQTVRNENDRARGSIALSSAFAFSCNTTAANLGLALPAGALLKAAQSLGLGGDWTLPVDAFSGSMPEPSGPSARNDQAADSYGQGKVLVSPLLMAEMAGAATTGQPIAPSLIEGKQATPGGKLAATVTAQLNTLMRDVVTVPGATGRALAGLPGPVQGKTGTAEFGTAVPAQSHSWFAGTRGDLAFSVFVNGGGNSDSAAGAVPVAKTFLTALPL